jgi:hypothetical protein
MGSCLWRDGGCSSSCFFASQSEMCCTEALWICSVSTFVQPTDCIRVMYLLMYHPVARGARAIEQAKSEGMEWGRGVGLRCKAGAGVHMNGRQPVPRETCVTHFGGTTPFGSAPTKEAGRAVQQELQLRIPCTGAQIPWCPNSGHTCHDPSLVRTRVEPGFAANCGALLAN